MTLKRKIHQTLDIAFELMSKGDSHSAVLATLRYKFLSVKNRSTFYAPESEVFLWKELSETLNWYINYLYPEGLEVNEAEDWELELIELITASK